MIQNILPVIPIVEPLVVRFLRYFETNFLEPEPELEQLDH